MPAEAGLANNERDASDRYTKPSFNDRVTPGRTNDPAFNPQFNLDAVPYESNTGAENLSATYQLAL